MKGRAETLPDQAFKAGLRLGLNPEIKVKSAVFEGVLTRRKICSGGQLVDPGLDLFAGEALPVLLVAAGLAAAAYQAMGGEGPETCVALHLKPGQHEVADLEASDKGVAGIGEVGIEDRAGLVEFDRGLCAIEHSWVLAAVMPCVMT